MKPKTYVAIILDKSGSMSGTKDAAISGFNEQIQQLKEDSKNQEIFCSLVTFNGSVYEHLWNVPADQLTEANVEDYVPSGNTAMRDAIGYTVQKLLDTTDHADPDTAYLIVTISDGQTNSDMKYNWNALSELVKSCENTKKWTFTYMGCTKEYLEQISAYTGTSRSNMASWSNASAEKASLGFSNMRSRQAKYFDMRSKGATSTPTYTSDIPSVVANFAEEVDSTPVDCLYKGNTTSNVDVSLMGTGAKNLDEVLKNQPKYVQFNASSVSENKGVFANSTRVEWQN